MAEDEAVLTRLSETAGTVTARVGSDVAVDLEPYNWYAETCPCGLPPGDCTEHPRRASHAAAAGGRLVTM